MNKKTRIQIRMLVVLALLTALEIVLNRFLSINTAGWKIGFGFVPVVVAAMMFGPLAAGVVCGLADLIGALLFPIGPYFPGFTAVAFIMGAVWGLFLSGKKTKNNYFLSTVIPSVINNLVLGLFVNTLWVSILYSSKSYWGWFMYRLPEYAILIPLNLALIPALRPLCNKLKKMFF